MSDVVRAPAVVDGMVRINGLRPKTIERLRRTFSFPNPEYVKLLRMNRPVVNVPDRLECMLEDPDGGVHLPRGAVDLIRQTLAEDTTLPEWIDARERGAEIKVANEFDLRDYQTEGARAIATHVQGTVVLPCGGGKTMLAVGAIAQLARTTLVLVHTNDLLEQWAGVVRERLCIEPGIIAGGRATKLREVTIASVFKLDRLLTDTNNDLVRHFGFLIVDEAHHAPAKTFMRVIGRIPARWRLGLTATPDREDGLSRLIDWNFGPRLLERGVPELIERKWLCAPEVRPVLTALRFDADRYKDPRKRNDALSRLIESDGDRNRRIVDLVMQEHARGESVLVLSGRKAHCDRLASMLDERGVKAHVLTSKATKAQRKATLEAMRDEGMLNVVIATSLADEGLDIERLSRIVLAWPERAKGRTMQRVGRLMRPYHGKEPVLFDVVDAAVDTLSDRWLERRRVYKRLGLPLGEEMEVAA